MISFGFAMFCLQILSKISQHETWPDGASGQKPTYYQLFAEAGWSNLETLRTLSLLAAYQRIMSTHSLPPALDYHRKIYQIISTDLILESQHDMHAIQTWLLELWPSVLAGLWWSVWTLSKSKEVGKGRPFEKKVPNSCWNLSYFWCWKFTVS